MDDYVNVYDYVGDEKQEYSTATNVSKEEHEMQTIHVAPQKENWQIQIKQSSIGTNENQGQGNINGALTRRKFLLAMLILVILTISLAAIVLSIVSYNASDSKKNRKKTYQTLFSSIRIN